MKNKNLWNGNTQTSQHEVDWFETDATSTETCFIIATIRQYKHTRFFQVFSLLLNSFFVFCGWAFESQIECRDSRVSRVWTLFVFVLTGTTQNPHHKFIILYLVFLSRFEHKTKMGSKFDFGTTPQADMNGNHCSNSNVIKMIWKP